MSTNFTNCGGRYGFIMFLINWFIILDLLSLQEKGHLWFLSEEAWCQFFLLRFLMQLQDILMFICDAAWRIRDAEAAVMACISWIPLSLLRELGGITDQISTFVFLGCEIGNLKVFYPIPFYVQSWYVIGIFPKIFLLQRLLAIILHPQNQLCH